MTHNSGFPVSFPLQCENLLEGTLDEHISLTFVVLWRQVYARASETCVYFRYKITVRENSVSKFWSSQPCGNPKLYTPTQPQPPQSPTLKMMFIIAWQLNYPVVRAKAPSSVQNRSRPTSAGVGRLWQYEPWRRVASYHVCCDGFLPCLL